MYYTAFNKYFEGFNLIDGWEKDITNDNKPEFIFLSQNKNCPGCALTFNIFQGERKVFETAEKDPVIMLRNNGFTIKASQTKSYEWVDSEFKETTKIIEVK